jgi:hypothetical protein
VRIWYGPADTVGAAAFPEFAAGQPRCIHGIAAGLARAR